MTKPRRFVSLQNVELVVRLTPAQVSIIASAVAALRSSAYATWSAVVAAIAAGTITTTAQIDAPPSPIPAWPANS